MLIDITRLLDRYLKQRLPTGVDRVSLAYLEHFRERSSALVRFAGRWLELSREHSTHLFDILVGRGDGGPATIRWCVGAAYAMRWKKAQASVLFNTGHSGLDLPDYEHRIRQRGLRPVFFLHDLIPVSHPEYCRAGEADRHHRRLKVMLSSGVGMVVNSEATRQDLFAYADRFGFQVPPCIVAPLSPSKLTKPRTERPLSTPYFVVLGTIEPRKNHQLLLHVWRQLVAEQGEGAPRLVVIGQRGWECEQVVDLLDRCPGLQGMVIEKSRCDDVDLATWLFHAQALLFPSFVEGFGIPLVEAMMLGLPVIASDLPVFHEIAGNIPEYLDPLDGAGWKRVICDYAAEHSSYRDAQLQRMAGYVSPSWEQHFSVVEEFLEQLQFQQIWLGR